MGRRDDIDGLRALAVLAIVFYHLALPPSGGFVGVDIFFVISGYLITGRLIADHSLRRFYERRVRRILPALLLMLLISSAVAAALLMPLDLKSYGRSLLYTLGFASNVGFWRETSYFDELAVLKPLLHTWSLAVEERFYLGFPLFLMLFRRRLWPVVGAALISFALCVLETHHKASTAFYLSPFRAWEFLMGAILTLWAPPLRFAPAAVVAGFALIAFSFSYSEATLFPGYAAVAPCLGAALLLYAGESKWAAPLRWAPMVLVGRISYSMYLWHWPLAVFYRYLFGEPGYLAAAGLFALIFCLSYLSWRYVEEPIRKRRRLPRIWLPAAAAMAGMVLAGALLLTGLPARYPPAAVAAEKASLDRDNDNHCHNRKPDQIRRGELCVIGDAYVAPRWIIWGDSHGHALQGVFDEALKRDGQSAFVATRDGCVPLTGVSRVGYPACGPFAAAVKTFAHRRGLQTVLIANWNGYRSVILTDRLSRTTGPKESLAVIARGLRRSQFGLVSDPLPGAPAAVPRALAQHIAYGLPVETWSRTQYLEQSRVYFEAVGQRPRISLWKDICRTGICETERGARPLYFDSNHPALSNFSFAVPIVASALKPR